MRTVNKVARLSLLMVAIIAMLYYIFHKQDTNILVFSFGCAIMGRLEAVYDKLNEK